MARGNKNNLRKRRIKRGVTVRTLSDLLGYESIGTYYKKESGELRVTLEEAAILAAFYETTIEELFFNQEIAKMDNEEGK